MAALAVVGIGVLATAGTWGYSQVAQDLPPVDDIESLFDPASGGLYRTTRFYDRSGQVTLLEALNPAAASRRALPVDPARPAHIPEALIEGIIALADQGFWSNPGYESDWLAEAVHRGLRGLALEDGRSITQRLVGYTLLPPGEQGRPAWARPLREALLAAELTQAYSKEQILAWYLNSVPMGNRAYGVDAAALVYFGKHASELTLAESALLAAVADDAALNPWDAPQQAKARQSMVLEALVEAGALTQEEASAARAEPLALRPASSGESQAMETFAAYAWARLETTLGPGFTDRGGLRVVTSLDLDLQLQADCVLRTYLERMSGGDSAAIIPAADGSVCVAASLLGPLRPSDAGVDHGLTTAAVVVLDPKTGEVLCMLGPAAVEMGGARALRSPGSAFYPFIYLTAFARGYSPASMVLDIPTVLSDPTGASLFVAENLDGSYRGPIRMRTALANTYAVPALRVLSLMGETSVRRTAIQMGLTTVDPTAVTGPALMVDQLRVTLLDLTFAYGLFGGGGLMAGAPTAVSAPRAAGRSVDPAAILRVEDAEGRVIYAFEPEERAVLSSELAYLMANVLSDETARWPALGHPNPLEVARPAGALVGMTSENQENWAVGFVPSMAVGVWVGNENGLALSGVGAVNGAAPVWNAVMRYATRERAAEGWTLPAGVSQVDVCDPSGLLPTEYCPNTVREVFLQGTEPTHYDTLFQPFRINRETGKLATLFTPISLVDERVYLVPPPEATEWAVSAGLDRPPQEYDTLDLPPPDPEVNIAAPEAFALLRGIVRVEGTATLEGFSYYRLQYGAGLNPSRWVQVGEDLAEAVPQGRLGTWDTRDLSGVYVLQLLVVLEDGRIRTAAVPVTIDNQPPEVRLVVPEAGEVFTWPGDREVILQAEVSDDLSLDRVEFLVDNRVVGCVEAPPYSMRWPLGTAGEHSLYARAYDTAGNRAESERLAFTIARD